MKRIYSPLRGLCAVGLLLVIAGCSVNPATGQREFSLVSEGQEVAIGLQADHAAQDQYGLYPDAELARHVDQIGQRLAKTSERPDLKWTFRVIDTPVVNAFAIPGGHIFVTRGILATLNSDAQLAGVMGHEIGHVTARHTAKQMTQQQIAGLGLGLGTAFVHGFDKVAGLASQGIGLLFLKYSRDDETQADELGIRYATRAGFDPREIPATYAMLKKLSEKEGQSIPGFLSTHPDPGDRETRTRTLADQAVAGKTGSLLINANEYKQTLAALVYGDDPRQGYLDGARFYHPEMHFQLDFPDGWKVDNGRAAITARASNGAGMQLTIEKSTVANPENFPASLTQGGKITSFAGQAETIGGYPAWTGTVTAPDGQGGQQVMLAAWLRRDPGELFQFLGGPATDAATRTAFLGSVRSLRNLTDPARMNLKPDELAIRRADGQSALSKMIKDTPSPTLGESDVAWLNGIDAGSRPKVGFLLKVPRKGQ